MSQNSVDKQIKEIFKREGLSWARVVEVTGGTSRASARRNLLGWLEKANGILNRIGYKVAIVPINEDEEKVKK